MRIVRLTKETTRNILENMLKRSPGQYGEYEKRVQDILLEVKEKKDKAVFGYTKPVSSICPSAYFSTNLKDVPRFAVSSSVI